MVTIQILPYGEIADLTSIGRIRKILKIAKENRIVLIQGRLKKEEESELIKTTMEEINEEFKGIELAVIYPDEGREEGTLGKIRTGIINSLLGDRQGLTVIGPASIVKEIKKDPNKIQLLTTEQKAKKKKRKRR